MKNPFKFIYVVVAAGFILASCEGPMGPAGKDGANGKDGADGKDANATCTQCHSNSTVIEQKLSQYEESIHATGENYAYANRTGCVRCHTSQGFLEYVAEGTDANISVPTNPMTINCYTCHEIHTAYTDDDWALTKPGAETLILKYAGAAVTYNKGNSNQCVGCHQARDVNPAPVADGADFTIAANNTRIGVHHAPMANILLGKIPFELPGLQYPTSNPHYDNEASEGCLTCHMADPYGYMAGGHNMGMMYSQHGGPETLNNKGCLKCHTDAASVTADFTEIQALVQAKLDTLQYQLVAAGVFNTTTELANAGTFNANTVLAYLNYDAVVQDKSLGVHNPGYIKTMLENSITAMVDLGFAKPGAVK